MDALHKFCFNRSNVAFKYSLSLDVASFAVLEETHVYVCNVSVGLIKRNIKIYEIIFLPFHDLIAFFLFCKNGVRKYGREDITENYGMDHKGGNRVYKKRIKFWRTRSCGKVTSEDSRASIVLAMIQNLVGLPSSSRVFVWLEITCPALREDSP